MLLYLNKKMEIGNYLKERLIHMQLTQQLIRYCQLTNITPKEGEDGKTEIKNIFLDSYKKGYLSSQQLKQIEHALEVN